VFARPACGLRPPLAATASGQVLSPGFSTRLPGLQITRRHQGFIRIRPSGLPLARSLPRTVRGPWGFFPELRTPTGRTRRRTSGRGSVTNTNRELRDRHRRPPIHELTHMRDIASHPQVLIIAPADGELLETSAVPAAITWTVNADAGRRRCPLGSAGALPVLPFPRCKGSRTARTA